MFLDCKGIRFGQFDAINPERLTESRCRGVDGGRGGGRGEGGFPHLLVVDKQGLRHSYYLF